VPISSIAYHRCREVGTRYTVAETVGFHHAQGRSEKNRGGSRTFSRAISFTLHLVQSLLQI